MLEIEWLACKKRLNSAEQNVFLRALLAVECSPCSLFRMTHEITGQPTEADRVIVGPVRPPPGCWGLSEVAVWGRLGRCRCTAHSRAFPTNVLVVQVPSREESLPDCRVQNTARTANEP